MIVCMTLNLPTEAAMVAVVRHQVDALLQRMCVSEDDVYRAGVVISEACSNVVRHAYDGPGGSYRVDIEYHPDRLILTVTDSGKGFNPGEVPTPSPGQIGGYGLYFIKDSADRVEFLPVDGPGAALRAEILLRYQHDDALRFAQCLNALPEPASECSR